MIVWAALVAIAASPGVPLPTDDMLYVDAAVDLALGRYLPPGPARPYHHFLRWPVVLPLAGLVRVFRYGAVAIVGFSVLHFVVIALLTFVLVDRVYRDSRIAAASTLALALPPIGVLPALIRSEPPALLFVLAALVVAGGGRGARSWWWSILGGALLAVAVDATQVTVFLVPAVVGYLWWDAGRPNPLAVAGWRLAIGVCLGLALGTIAIMAAEWGAFGDFLLQPHTIAISHIGMVDRSDWWSGLWDPGNHRWYLFGFVAGWLRTDPWFVACAGLGVVLALQGGRRYPGLGGLLITAVGGLLSLELLGTLAVEKLYLRFTVVPAYLACVLAAAELARRIRDARTVAGKGASGALLAGMIGLGAAHVIASPTADPWLLYYRQPIAAIARAVAASGVSPAQTAIFYSADRSVGLIDWSRASVYYSNRSLQKADRRTEAVPEAAHLRRLNFFLLEERTAIAPPPGFTEIGRFTVPGLPSTRVLRLDRSRPAPAPAG